MSEKSCWSRDDYTPAESCTRSSKLASISIHITSRSALNRLLRRPSAFMPPGRALYLCPSRAINITLATHFDGYLAENTFSVASMHLASCSIPNRRRIANLSDAIKRPSRGPHPDRWADPERNSKNCHPWPYKRRLRIPDIRYLLSSSTFYRLSCAENDGG